MSPHKNNLSRVQKKTLLFYYALKNAQNTAINKLDIIFFYETKEIYFLIVHIYI